MMRAIVQDRYGLPDVLELREVDIPVPDEGEVRIRVVAASLNMYDWHMTTGAPNMLRLQQGMRSPKNGIPGSDVSGVVDKVGSGVTRFSTGDEVMAFVGHGALAEFVSVKEEKLALKPANVTFEQAAATPLAAITALEGLRDVGKVQPGQRVLINGASGGVGTFAVQLAKAFGAHVTAVCSTSKVNTVRSIGADEVIDYTRQDFIETQSGFDVLFDNVGDRPWSQTRRVLTPDGIQVTVTGPKHRLLGPLREFAYRRLASSFSGQTWAVCNAKIERNDVEYVAGLLASGEVTPVIENTYPLEKTAEAMRYLGEGHALGKLVITP